MTTFGIDRTGPTGSGGLVVASVSEGGTGVSTLADGGILVGNGTSPVEVVAPGATTEILVGGGAATNPVWTTATGSGAPVRATNPTLVAPVLGTPSSGTLTNCDGYPGTSLTVINAKGDLIIGTADNTAARQAVPANGSLLLADSSQTNGWVESTSAAARKNAVINGGFDVAQRGVTFTSATNPANSDDTYLLDRWYILSDGNDTIDVTQDSTTIPTNGLFATALDVETANKKFGIAQIIEQKNCKGFIGNTCTLSFKAKVSATTNLDNLKAAIIAWDGTADTVTSDVVSAWNVEGTNPTLVANCTYENTPANLSPTTSYATYSVSAAIDTASTKNIIVFIWSDVTTTTVGGADILYITDVQLEVGSVATGFEYSRVNEQLALCERYYAKTFPYSVAPAQAAGMTGAFSSDYAYANGAGCVILWHFPVTMRAAPTTTTYNPTQANANWRNQADSADANVNVNSTVADNSISYRADTTTAIGNPYLIHIVAVSEL